MSPRDDIVLRAVVGDQCNKLAVDHRRYCQLSWQTTGHFITLSVHKCQLR